MYFFYPKSAFTSLENAFSVEWLETNGLGGYASSTAINCHTRKYHGLLVSKLDNLADKYVLFSKVEDLLLHDGQEVFLTAHIYPSVCQDGGFTNLEVFKYTTHPVWHYTFAAGQLIKEFMMLYQEDSVLFKYTIIGQGTYKISFRPLLACRNFHRLQHENTALESRVETLDNGFSYAPYANLPRIFFQVNTHCEFLSDPKWYRNCVYGEEQARGYDYLEDLFSPGVLVFAPKIAGEVIVSCSLQQQKTDLSCKWQQELQRRQQDNIVGDKVQELYKQLQHIGRSFITSNTANHQPQAMVAGYHWFLEWGRDTMISLSGLTLCSGDEETCLMILKNFAKREVQGLIPNFLGVTNASDAYNSVDVSLWFALAVQQYYLVTKNIQTIITYFWSTLKNIFKYYSEGTRYNIKMQTNGLLYAGSEKENLTWMDAVIAGHPVTPRFGYQVEINALWFNFLNFMLELAVKVEDKYLYEKLRSIIPLTQQSFREVFWCKEKEYLYDFVNEYEKNSLLRPNQIFAVSLPYSPLLMQMAVKSITAVREYLLTPYGLRTLARHEPGYVGCYTGDQNDRDRAYHNGTIWPWLLGHFTSALLKITSDKRKVIEVIYPCLLMLHRHLAEYGIGSIAEIFSGDPPYRPNGCISQAWSVAEVLRLMCLLYGK